MIGEKMLGEYSIYPHACLECRIKFCREVCPIYTQTRNESHGVHGFNMLALSVYRGLEKISDELVETLAHCTTCGACQYRCPNTLFGGDFYNITMPTPDLVEQMREDLINTGYENPIHKKLLERWQTYLNPYGEPIEKRSKWVSSEYGEKLTGLPEKAPHIYFAGCTAALRHPEIAVSTVKILDFLDLDFTIIKEEPCCGSVFLRTGYKKQAEKLAKENVEKFKEMGVEKIITSCGGCYRTFKVDYPKLVGDTGVEIIHTSELLAELPEGKKVRKLKGKVTYHDPCHIGRAVGLFEPPRTVIKNLGLDLVEMDHTMDNARCCGAGGGVRATLPETSMKIAKARIQEAEQTGAKSLISTCPFCKRNLRDAAKELKSEMKVLDITEIFARALPLR